MADIHPLSDAHLSTNVPCEDVIALLRALLKEAEHGEIIGLAVACVEGNNRISSCYAAGCADKNLMMASVHGLHTDITRLWYSSFEDLYEKK